MKTPSNIDEKNARRGGAESRHPSRIKRDLNKPSGVKDRKPRRMAIFISAWNISWSIYFYMKARPSESTLGSCKPRFCPRSSVVGCYGTRANREQSRQSEARLWPLAPERCGRACLHNGALANAKRLVLCSAKNKLCKPNLVCGPPSALEPYYSASGLLLKPPHGGRSRWGAEPLAVRLPFTSNPARLRTTPQACRHPSSPRDADE